MEMESFNAKCTGLKQMDWNDNLAGELLNVKGMLHTHLNYLIYSLLLHQNKLVCNYIDFEESF